MAKFDLTFYNGEDSYSDGDIEDYILNAVKDGKSLDDIEAKDRTWPVFYHLSPVRENVCNWYPFKKDATILEIGAGCGAITGVLCQNAKKVTSVDLSKRRASINYERNKQYDNLEIIVGNLNDIVLEEKYDYITLIGVLEYAGRFTEGEKPFHTFLNNMKKYLKPDGALLIAIENRLGLKYFSGASEDHTNIIYDGINGYPKYSGVKTFSKSELTELLNECNFNKTRFYYPYPDYKLPSEIFTDESENRNKKPYNTYDMDRFSLFREADLYNALQKEGVSASFENSFFVEARDNTECDESVIYAKLNQERKPEFRVGTVICKKDGEEVVVKKAFHHDALKHVKKISLNDEKSYGDIKVNKGIDTEKEITYSFINLKSLEELLKESALSGNAETFKGQIKRFFDCAFSFAEVSEYNTSQFKAVFGDSELVSAKDKCVSPANIDLTPANVFCDKESYILSDCEWVFDFPIPVNYIIWRAVRSLYVSLAEIGKTVSERELLYFLGVKEEEENVFEQWENNLINEYICSKGQGIPKKNELKQLVYDEDQEIERLRREVQVLNQRIDAAHRQMERLSHLKTFTLLNVHNRFNSQYKHGTKEDREEFKKWFNDFVSGRERDNSYNALLQIDNILYGRVESKKEVKRYGNVELKNAKRIDIITPGHTLYVAKQIKGYLNEFNIESEIHAPEFCDYEPIPYIVFCPQIMPQLPECYIAYQMEQTINSRWLTDKYIEILEQAEAILDYSKVNIEYFGKYEKLKDKLYYVPIGVSKAESVDDAFLENQKYDVLFYGDINCDRRKRIIDELKKSFNVRVEHDLFGDEMHEVIRQSKVVINIHYYENAMLETTRLAEILSLGTSIIVSEKSCDREEEVRMEGLVDFVEVGNTDEMKERISHWLGCERKDKLEEKNRCIVNEFLDSKRLFLEFLQRNVIH